MSLLSTKAVSLFLLQLLYWRQLRHVLFIEQSVLSNHGDQVDDLRDHFPARDKVPVVSVSHSLVGHPLAVLHLFSDLLRPFRLDLLSQSLQQAAGRGDGMSEKGLLIASKSSSYSQR